MKTISALALCLALASCSTSMRTQALEHVPADTPYVAYAGGDLEESWDLWAEPMRPLTDMMRGLGVKANEGPDTMTRIVLGLLEVTEYEVNAKGMRRLGVEPNGPHVLYGRPLMPVVRLTLSDSERFRGALTEIAQRAGLELPPETVVDGTYFRVFRGRIVTLVLGIRDGQLLVTMTERKDESLDLPRLVGLQRVEKALSDSPRMSLLNEYEMGAEFFMLLDFERGLSALSDKTVDGWSEDIDMSPACRQAALAMIREAPVVEAGSLDGNAAGYALAIWRMSESLVGTMTRLAVPMPTFVPGDDRPMLVGGLHLDVGELATVMMAWLERLSASPCGPVAEFGAVADELRPAVNHPMASLFLGVQGVQVAVHELDPQRGAFRGWLLLKHHDLDKLLSILPLLGRGIGLSIPFVRDGAAPVRLELPDVPMVTALELQRHGSMLAISAGRGMSRAVASHLGGKEARGLGFFGADERRLDALSAQFDDDDDDLPDEVTEQMEAATPNFWTYVWLDVVPEGVRAHVAHELLATPTR